jgi:hypothetical protein
VKYEIGKFYTRKLNRNDIIIYLVSTKPGYVLDYKCYVYLFKNDTWASVYITNEMMEPTKLFDSSDLARYKKEKIMKSVFESHEAFNV